MTDKELAEIEKRAANATEGPWFTCGRGGEPWTVHFEPPGESTLDGVPLTEMVCDCRPTRNGFPLPSGHPLNSKLIPNAWFIANARADVPALVAEVRRLKGLLAKRKVAK